MTPKEIQQLIQQSPALREALATNKATVWTFLRDETSLQYVLPCEKCETRTQLLRSPYAQDLCIECLLEEMKTPLENPYADPRSRLYDAQYAEAYDNPGCRAWVPADESEWWS